MNKVTIRLLEDLSPIQIFLTNLRYIRKIGQTEIINHTQLGKLNDQSIKYEIVPR